MNFDMNAIMSMLSNMDKEDLEAGIAGAHKILQSKSTEEIMKDLNNK